MNRVFDVKCLRFKSYQKGSLLGFADFRIENLGIDVFGCNVYQKDGRRWINLPSKEFVNENQEKKYSPIVKMIEPEKMKEFTKEANRAIDEVCKQNYDDEDVFNF